MKGLANALLLLGAWRVSLTVSAQSTAADDDAAPLNNDPLQYVSQLVGSNNGGNVFVGATLPNGMVKSVADVTGENTCGFATDGSNITGFSHMHDNGVGSAPSLGNFPLFPQSYCPGDVLDNCIFIALDRAVNYKNDSLKTSPGYFGLELVNDIGAEMTVSNHTALYHFTFPENSSDGSPISPLMLLDLTDLDNSRQNASISVDPDTGRIKGNGTFIPSFGSGSFESYFCADFQGASIRDTGVYVNNRAGTYPKELFVVRGINAFYIEAGGFVRFNKPAANNTITARVGMSFISSDKACENAEKEVPDWNFNRLKTGAEEAWREKLNYVSVEAGGVSDDYLVNFWSGVYRTFISPQDYTGENPLWQSDEPYFDSFYCMWDLFRAQQPFMAVIDPYLQSRQLRSLIDTYKHLGWLPDCRMSLSKGFTQGGSNSDVALIDAYLKKVPGVNWEDAYEAVKKDAENEPFDWSVEGRGGSISYKTLGYIPQLDYDYLGYGTNSRSISRTIEYAYNDFCVGTLAKSLGKMADFQKYNTRSGAWQYIYKPDQRSYINGTDTGFSGFFQPKNLNGTFGYLDPIECSNLDGFCSLTTNPTEVFESSIWEYQFFVPQSQAALIRALGGPETYVKRLDYLHDEYIVSIGNEPSFLTVYNYHYAGRPGRSAYRAHFYIPSSFNSSYGGLPGNDDSGTMGAFVAFTMSGLFPVAGQDVYLIIPPFFQSVSYKSRITGKVATIRNVNFDAAYKNIYIQSATLNGTAYTRSWITHDFFLNGGVLELTLGPAESAWGTHPQDLPPSYEPVRGPYANGASGNASSAGNMTAMDFGFDRYAAGLD